MRVSVKVIFLSIFLVITILAARVYADRAAPPAVQPMEYNGIRYEVPNTVEKMGVIQAYDKSTGKKLWEKKAYRVFINPMAEKDTQWVFIKQIGIENGKLVVTNEKEKQVKLDPVTGKKGYGLNIALLLLVIGALGLGLIKFKLQAVKDTK